jgi:hypothetical protein
MSFVRCSFLKRHTAVCSAILVVATFGFLGCGGTGERLKPGTDLDTDASSNAGVLLNSCELAASLETHIIGCPDVKGAYTRCMDFEDVGAPANAKTDYDPIPLTNPAPADCKNSPPSTVCIDPLGDMNSSPIPVGEGHCGTSTRAFHFVAKGEFRWGPSAYVQYEYPPYPTTGIDVTAWDGLAFWAKLGSQPTGESMFVSIMDKPTNGEAIDANGVMCLTAPLAPDPVKCDSFGFSIGIESAWKYVVLPFSDLRQRGFGIHADSVDLTHVVQLKFSLDIGDWDVWIDDVALYRHR